jgi:osmotically-inducible protein OsmY
MPIPKAMPMKALISRSTLSAAALSGVLLGGCAAPPAQESIGEYIDDAAITTKIESGLLAGEGIWSSDIIHVDTVQGVVHLDGYAADQHARERAGEVARSVAGVKLVNNDLRVR